jgi:hypothetical protein
MLAGILGKADGVAGEPLILKSSGYDVFGNYNADGGGHCSCSYW